MQNSELLYLLCTKDEIISDLLDRRDAGEDVFLLEALSRLHLTNGYFIDCSQLSPRTAERLAEIFD